MILWYGGDSACIVSSDVTLCVGVWTEDSSVTDEVSCWSELTDFESLESAESYPPVGALPAETVVTCGAIECIAWCYRDVVWVPSSDVTLYVSRLWLVLACG